ncbi:MAG: prolyl oligopeptidase family serine peptidase, partial [Planctomycetaceae bacterium]
EGLKRKRKDVTNRDLDGSPDQQKAAAGKASSKKADKKSKKTKSDGSTLVLHNLNSGLERRFPYVTSQAFSKHGERLAFATSKKDDDAADGVHILNLANEKAEQVISGLGNYRSLSFNEDGSMLAFMSDRDDYEADKPSWSLYLVRKFKKTAEKVAHAGDEGIPKDWWLASSSGPIFSEDGRRLYFSTAPIPEDVKTPKAKDEEPKAKLDLWHWKDKQLQPQQLLQAARERNRSYRAVYDLRARKIVQLATKEIPNVSIDFRSKSDLAVGVANEKYQYMLSWETPGFSDLYLIDQKTGESQLVAEKIRARGQMSPGGKYLSWFDPEQLKWYAMSTKTRKAVEISKGTKVSFANELHDTPSLPRSYGSAGWMADDEAILVYDRFDIWKLDPTGKEPAVKLTNGRESKVRHRYQRIDSEQRFIDAKQPLMLTLFNEATKATGFGSLDVSGDKPTVVTHLMLDEALGGLRKAKDADTVLFTRSTFRKCPDLWASTTAFKNVKRLSRINPQQRDYLWGSAELVTWQSKDNKPLDGILYKPEGFDETKKYPLMVYYYERSSDRLHTYYAPAAGRSIINFSFYVSRGYCLFVPDIPYTTGFPGESAAKAILPGVESIVAKGFIDKDRIGMQGHSWGGYQAAYLVTQTDMFACAESGAPVSNMTSAYGGIRWGSGMSRMFQYERTQSRIGETLWEGRDKYIANSPVFFADKINTPLLILHNDEDGAVPWYQGIELFVAMRRLGKPAWMMNYNGEPHWVMKKENRLDFAKRMQQFFDHYLQGAPEPEWMATGIPAVNKGKKFGFEPTKKKAQEPTEAVEKP